MESNIFQYIRNKGTVYLGWRVCKAYEHYDVLQCFKCAGYHHIAGKCENQLTCYRCGDNHKTSECTSEEFKCINCFKAVQRTNVNIAYDHMASDRACPCYTRIVNREISKTQYEF